MATQIESSLALIREYIAYNEFDLIWIKSPKVGIAVDAVVGSIGKDGYRTRPILQPLRFYMVSSLMTAFPDSSHCRQFHGECVPAR